MLSGILQGAPVWVWPLLALVLLVGLLSMRSRRSPVWPFYLMPLFGILAIRATAAMQVGPEIWALFGASYGAGAVLGWWVQPRWISRRDATHVALQGKALTLVMVVTVFSANFAVGTLRAVAPNVVAGGIFQAGFVVITGLVSGLFLGRSLAIIAAPRASRAG